VTLVGEIDMECQPELDAALRQVLTAPPGPVSVELAELTFLASCGVEFLARLQRAVRPEGPVTLRDPSRVVLRILDITGLTDQFVIVPPPG
jgi:anti-anti-sigma factor